MKFRSNHEVLFVFYRACLLLSMRYLLHVWSLIPISELHPLNNKSYPFLSKKFFHLSGKNVLWDFWELFWFAKKNCEKSNFLFLYSLEEVRSPGNLGSFCFWLKIKFKFEIKMQPFCFSFLLLSLLSQPSFLLKWLATTAEARNSSILTFQLFIGILFLSLNDSVAVEIFWFKSNLFCPQTILLKIVEATCWIAEVQLFLREIVILNIEAGFRGELYRLARTTIRTVQTTDVT